MTEFESDKFIVRVVNYNCDSTMNQQRGLGMGEYSEMAALHSEVYEDPNLYALDKGDVVELVWFRSDGEGRLEESILDEYEIS